MFTIGMLKRAIGSFMMKMKWIYYSQMLNSTKLKDKFNIKINIKNLTKESYSLLYYLNILKSNFTYSLSKNHLLKNYHSIILLYSALDISTNIKQIYTNIKSFSNILLIQQCESY